MIWAVSQIPQNYNLNIWIYYLTFTTTSSHPLRNSVGEPPGAATFKAALEPEQFFWSVGAESKSRLCKAAPAGFL